MSAHNHTEHVEGCYRCDLSRDEVRDQFGRDRLDQWAAGLIDLTGEEAQALVDEVRQLRAAEFDRLQSSGEPVKLDVRLPTRSAGTSTVLVATLAVEHIDDSDICEKCNERHQSCHCYLPEDCERGRGMCTACDDARCDTNPNECPCDAS